MTKASHPKPVKDGGKVRHVGGSLVGLRLSTFRGNVRLSVQQKRCSYQSRPRSIASPAISGLTAPVCH